MCIRDRPKQSLVKLASIDEDALGEEIEVVWELEPGAHVIAVSYTHLRAHETVLDLVCRLLLEKQKKQTHHESTDEDII